MFKIFGNVNQGDIGARRFPRHFQVFTGKFIHHHAPIFAVGDLGDKRRNFFAREVPARKAYGLIIGLHLRDQFRVAALCFNYGDNAYAFAFAIAADQPVRKMLL